MDFKRLAHDSGRMGAWGYLALLTSIGLFVLYPHQLGTVLMKANLLALAAWAGYWIDRSAFPYARPGDLIGPERSAAATRRAVIIAGAMLSMALAL